MDNKKDIIPIDQLPVLPVDKLPIPFSRDIFLFSTYIAGTSYINNIDDIIKTLNIGDEVNFYREINNRHDKYAIVVKTNTLIKIGYIPSIDNLVFARLLDAGKLLIGKVKEIKKQNKWNRIEIDIYMKD